MASAGGGGGGGGGGAGLPRSPIIPLSAPLLQGQQQQQQNLAPQPPSSAASSSSSTTAANKPKSTLPLPVILPLTVSIPPSTPSTPPSSRGRSRRRGKQAGSGRSGKTTSTTTAISPATTPLSSLPSSPAVSRASPVTIPNIAVSPVAPLSAASAVLSRPLTPQEIQQVENLIERCLHLYMNQEEVIMALQLQANIAPNITRHVWQEMESKNSDFFKAYDVRLKIKEQITAFNYLVSQQAQVTENAKSTPSGASVPSSGASGTNPFLLGASPLSTMGGAALGNGFEPLPSPFGAPAMATVTTSQIPAISQPATLTSSLSSLLTAVQPPLGSLSPSRESALTLSTNSLINSFLNASSDGLAPSSSSDASTSTQPSAATVSSSTFAPSLSFTFGPAPTDASSSMTVSASAPASLLFGTAAASNVSASAPASLLLGLPGQNDSRPLLSSGAFSMPFISVENTDSTTPFSPFTPFSAPSATIIAPSSPKLPSSSSPSAAAATNSTSPMAIPRRTVSLLGSTGGSNLLSTSPNSLNVMSVSPLSTSPSDAASFLTSSISSIPLTASTNALLEALGSFGGESPSRVGLSPLLRSSTAATGAPQAPALNSSLEGLFPDSFLTSSSMSLGGDDGSSLPPSSAK